MTFSMEPIYIIQAEHRPDLMQNRLNDAPESCFIHQAASRAATTQRQMLGRFYRNTEIRLQFKVK